MARGLGRLARGAAVVWRPAAMLSLAMLLALVGVLIPGSGGGGVALAASCEVTTTNDTGAGSLRAHLADIGCDAITFQAGLSGTITLGSDLPTVTRVVSVNGTGAPRLTINRNNTASGVAFRVGTWGALTLRGLTVTGARDGVSLVANSWATVVSSTLSGNSNALTFNQGGSATVANSTLNANTGVGLAFNQGGRATVTNSTLSGNGTGLSFASGGSATLSNALLAKGGGPNCAVSGGTLTNGGRNLADDASCFADGANGSIVVAAGQAGLDPGGLKDNGGPTRTIALTATSPALDAGDAAVCAQAPTSNADQRGAARPFGPGCDIGAVERGPAPVGGCVVTTNLDGISPVPAGSLREKMNNPDCGAISVAPEVVEKIVLNPPGTTLPTVTSRVVVLTGARIQPGGVPFALGTKGDLTLVGSQVLGATTIVTVDAAATQVSLAILGGSTITASGSIAQFSGGGLVTVGNSTVSTGGNAFVVANGGAVRISGSTFVAGGNTISLSGGGTVSVANSTVVAGSVGISFSGSGTVSITDNSTITSGGGLLNIGDGGAVVVANSTLTAGTQVMSFGGSGSATVTGSTLSGPTGLISFGGQGSATVTGGRLTSAKGPGITFGGTGTAILHAANIRTFTDTLSFGSGGTATATASSLTSTTGNGVVLGSGTTAKLTSSTVSASGNAVSLAGTSTASLTSSTLSASGNAVSLTGTGAVTVTNSTLAANTANLAFSSGGTAALTNTLLAKGGGANCTGGTPTTNNHNLADDATCFADDSGPGNASNVVTTADLGLATTSPVDNGGPTQTIALTAASLARDAGDDLICAQTGPNTVNGIDQRGRSRLTGAGSHCDIGAFEFNSALTVTALTVAPASGPYAGTATLRATLTRIVDNAPVGGKTIAFTLNAGAACATCPATNSNGVATLAASLGTIAPGNYPAAIGGSFAGDSDYTPASAGAADLTVVKASQAITLIPDPLPEHAFGDVPFTVTASSSSGLTVSVAAGPSEVCTLSGTTMTIVGLGSCTVIASQAGDINYLPALEVIRSFRVVRATLALTNVRGDATYGDPTAVLTATLRRTNGDGGPVVGATVQFTLNGAPVGSATTNAQGVATLPAAALPPGLNAGTYANAVRASFAGNANQQAASAAGPLVVARKVLWVKPTDRTVVLGQPNPPTTPPAGCLVQATATSACWLELVNGSSFAYSQSWSALNLTNLRFSYSRNPPGTNATEFAGKTYRITAIGAVSSNYDIRYQQGTLTVAAP